MNNILYKTLCSLAAVMLLGIVLFNVVSSGNAFIPPNRPSSSAAQTAPWGSSSRQANEPTISSKAANSKSTATKSKPPKSSSSQKSSSKSPASKEEKPPTAQESSPQDIWFEINAVTLEQLCMIDGIGEKTAADILEFRSNIGAFDDLEQLLQIKGIGTKTFQKLCACLYLAEG